MSHGKTFLQRTPTDNLKLSEERAAPWERARANRRMRSNP